MPAMSAPEPRPSSAKRSSCWISSELIGWSLCPNERGPGPRAGPAAQVQVGTPLEAGLLRACDPARDALELAGSEVLEELRLVIADRGQRPELPTAHGRR